ncbi:MAG TPA: outer membrane beta-barrel protein [Candidatus Methylomirabilis sp.]|nr:outer membrane beta-barrel protein [Candidatus Methylomirabilis sp.]
MRSPTTYVAILIAVLGLVAGGAAQAAEAYHSRAERWEFTVQARPLGEQSVKFDGGTEISTNSDVGWGFGVGYNFDDHLELSFDINWNSPSFDAKIASATTPGTFINANSEMSISNLQFNLFYNFIAGPVTPYVSAGLGSTYIDSNIAYGNASTGCWYDPWWGYTCSTYQPSYSTSLFSYNTSVGVRWDLTRDVFLRAGIGKSWINWENGGSNDSFTTGRIDLGFSY